MLVLKASAEPSGASSPARLAGARGVLASPGPRASSSGRFVTGLQRKEMIRLRELGWSIAKIGSAVGKPDGTVFMHVRHIPPPPGGWSRGGAALHKRNNVLRSSSFPPSAHVSLPAERARRSNDDLSAHDQPPCRGSLDHGGLPKCAQSLPRNEQ